MEKRSAPTILALDFDGVLCNGLEEYFQTAWQAYAKLWPGAAREPQPDFAPYFFRLRPVIETGWEMPVLIHALVEGVEEATILQNWESIAPQLAAQQKLEPQTIAATVDGIRDEQIRTNLAAWLSLHQFYPGVIDAVTQRLHTETQVYIVTTKEGRFVAQLLQQAGLTFPINQIFGKEVKQPKHQTLRDFLKQTPVEPDATSCSIWFVEDRLKTLRSVQNQSDLAQVSLFLADWGYNTTQEKAQAAQDSGIYLLSLSEFSANFDQWPYC